MYDDNDDDGQRANCDQKSSLGPSAQVSQKTSHRKSTSFVWNDDETVPVLKHDIYPNLFYVDHSTNTYIYTFLKIINEREMIT